MPTPSVVQQLPADARSATGLAFDAEAGSDTEAGSDAVANASFGVSSGID